GVELVVDGDGRQGQGAEDGAAADAPEPGQPVFAPRGGRGRGGAAVAERFRGEDSRVLRTGRAGLLTLRGPVGGHRENSFARAKKGPARSGLPPPGRGGYREARPRARPEASSTGTGGSAPDGAIDE